MIKNTIYVIISRNISWSNNVHIKPINFLTFNKTTTISVKMTQNTNNLAEFIWSLADLLRGDFKQSQYGIIILPFNLLRRFEGVLEDSKEAVLAQLEKVQAMNLPEEAQEKLLLRASR